MSDTAITKSTRCEICQEGVAKYRCPRCLLQTCCLACVKKHKAADACSGLRDKTAYVNMKSFTDMHLLSDYRLLEDAGRKAEGANRDVLKRRSERPWHVNRLVTQARYRGVQLRVLPYPSTKRKENKTYFNNKTKQFSWHIEWIFPELGTKYAERVPEEMILKSALSKLLQSLEVNPVSKRQLQSFLDRQKPDNLRMLMKLEGRTANSPRYHALDTEKSVKENLVGRTVVEYPAIHVISCDKSFQYRILNPDGTEEINNDTNGTSSGLRPESDLSSDSSSSEGSVNVCVKEQLLEKITSRPEDLRLKMQTSTVVDNISVKSS